MICGLLECNAGDILMNGRSLKKDGRDYRNRIGLCPQDIVIWESLTCLEQLIDHRDSCTISANARPVTGPLQLLDRLGLADKKHALARTLSGGMKRRLNIALALVHRPELLILDEPQAGLDPQSRVLVREYIRSLAAQTTVILTTHDMDEADRLADRVAIIDHGKLLVLDTPDNLKKNVGDGDILELRVTGDPPRVDELQRSLPDSVRRTSYHEGTLAHRGHWPSRNFATAHGKPAAVGHIDRGHDAS